MYILCTCNAIKKELKDESFSCNLLKFCRESEQLFLILKLSSIIFIKKYSQVSQDTFEVLFLKNINRAPFFRFSNMRGCAVMRSQNAYIRKSANIHDSRRASL